MKLPPPSSLERGIKILKVSEKLFRGLFIITQTISPKIGETATPLQFGEGSKDSESFRKGIRGEVELLVNVICHTTPAFFSDPPTY